MATQSPSEHQTSAPAPNVCPIDHRALSQFQAAPAWAAPDRDAPEPPECMVLYFMQGACLLPQSMQFCGILVARELVKRPREIDLVEFSRSRLRGEQAEKVIRAMNAVHTKNEVAAHWRPDDTLSAMAAKAAFKLRKLGLHTGRPITERDLDGAWGTVISEGLGRLFSLARVAPCVPNRERLPINAAAASLADLEAMRDVLCALEPDNELVGLLEDAGKLVVHGELFRDEKRAYRAAVKRYGSYTPQADVCRDRIAAHFLAELQQRNPTLDWPSYLDYRHV